MSDQIPHREPHVGDVPGHDGAADHHAVADHGDDGGHDDHGHASEPLGPIDIYAWSAGAVGILLGLAVALAFALSVGRVQVPGLG
jgi:hypothetical protein